MDGVNETRMDLIAAWRLLNYSQDKADQAKGKNTKAKSFKETLEKERELFGLNNSSVEKQNLACQKQDNVNIDLSKLIDKLKSLENNSNEKTTEPSRQVTLAYERKETEVTVSYRVLPRVEGLIVRNNHLAETDRYAFEFLDGATFKITDKWSGKSTTIWGDPHIDTSDEEGNCNGEFSDLKSSDTYTTLHLQDGTLVTFTAKDNGLIEAVDIYKNKQHLIGYGMAYADISLASQLFIDQIDITTSSNRVPQGDMVYAGGDGNDWFDTAGQLVWGQTTGSPVLNRPHSVMEVNIRQSIESVFLSGTVDKQK